MDKSNPECSTTVSRYSPLREDPHEWVVDPYVDHADVEKTMRGRLSEGWKVHSIIKCQPSKGRDYVTILWNPKYDIENVVTVTTKG